MTRPGLFRTYCYLLAFGGGFSVMLLEMCAFRVLQTNFGSSIYVTGVLLALIMVALSLGYYLGGRLSRRSSSLGILLIQLVVAVVHAALVNGILNESILDWSFDLRKAMPSTLGLQSIPPAIATFLLYFLPMLILSQISPYLIKVMSSDAAQLSPAASSERTTPPESKALVGSSAGNLMAISTVGSILGTLLPSFVFIPQFGVTGTMRLFKMFIVLLVIMGWLVSSRRHRALVAVTTALSMGALLLLPRQAMSGVAAPEAGRALIFESESHYGNVKVYRELDADEDEQLLLMPWRDYEHSTVHPKKPLKNQFTTAHVNVGVMRGAKNYLLLGTALGGVASALMELDPTVKVTAVEIDPVLVELAKEYSPQLHHPNVKFVVEDARVFLRETDETYDYVIADVFAGEQVPAHCISVEFMKLARARLAKNGVLHMNTNLMDNAVSPGMGGDEVFSASHHLQSAVLHAGFNSLYQSEFFLHGHLYAFAESTEPAALRAELTRFATDSAHQVDIRASAALAALTLVPVPDARRQIRPFSDAWVPEHLLHLKQNFAGHLKSLLTASSRAGWAERTGSQTDLKMIVARHYAKLGAESGPTVKSFKQYMKGPGGAEFCTDVARWVGQSPVAPYPDLARYFHTLALEDCHAKLSEDKDAIASKVRGAERFIRYLDASMSITNNHAAVALPSLLEMSSEL